MARRLSKPREVLQAFATRAYRRPVAAEELDALVKLVDVALRQGETFERGLQVALAAVLTSPQFLFRLELDPAPDDPRRSAR